ncbi:MAG: hypothetical protein GY754_31975 [bacterium]|nr:hypothetical protein [bacterium]
MKKLLLAVLITIVSAGLLFSERSLMQKKLGVVLENAVGHCYTECKEFRSVKRCNKAIDDLEVEIKELFKTAKTTKVDSTDKNAKEAAVIMKKYCPKAGKGFVKAIDK